MSYKMLLKILDYKGSSNEFTVDERKTFRGQYEEELREKITKKPSLLKKLIDNINNS